MKQYHFHPATPFRLFLLAVILCTDKSLYVTKKQTKQAFGNLFGLFAMVR